jgi:hypothetical protein
MKMRGCKVLVILGAAIVMTLRGRSCGDVHRRDATPGPMNCAEAYKWPH